MVYLHKMNMDHHSNQCDDDGTGKNRSVLCEEENNVGKQPHGAGVHHNSTYRHFSRTDCEFSAKARVTLTFQGYGFAVNVGKNLIFHSECKKQLQPVVLYPILG